MAVLALIADGLTDKEIADARKVRYSTIRSQVMMLLEKLGARTRTAAARWYLEQVASKKVSP
jgi:DNA-binding NarL/FixJ family response regulator